MNRRYVDQPVAIISGVPAFLMVRMIEREVRQGAMEGYPQVIVEQFREQLDALRKAADNRDALTDQSAAAPGAKPHAPSVGDEPHLTTSEAADVLGVGPERVRQLAKAGAIGHKHAGRWLFTRDELAAHRDHAA